MPSYHADRGRRSIRNVWHTTHYEVRRPGCAAWRDGIDTYDEACAERRHANEFAPGHNVYAAQVYTGDQPELLGETRRIRMCVA